MSLPKSIRTDNGNCSYKSGLFSKHKTLEKNYAACASALKLPENSNTGLREDLSGNGSTDNRLSLVPIRTTEDNAVLVRKLPGWSLLRWVFLRKRYHLENSSAKKSVYQWVLKLPSQQSSAVVYPDLKQNCYDRKKNRSSDLDGETSAIVPVGCEAIFPLSPCDFPEELQSLLEKSSSSCRLFSYQELLGATSSFMPGLFILAVNVKKKILSLACSGC